MPRLRYWQLTSAGGSGAVRALAAAGNGDESISPADLTRFGAHDHC